MCNICRLLPFFLFLSLSLLPARASALPVRAAVLMNMNTGQILYEKNATAPIPPASLTKIMNMFLALDAVRQGRISLAENVVISPDVARTGGSRMHLRRGEKTTLRLLLTGMAVASGNDAARAVAQCVSGSERSHVNAMNARARALGMRQTAFKNVTGLPAPGQTTCAADMLVLARAYLQRHPSSLAFHNTRLLINNGRQMRNTNNLLGVVDGVDGLKTGYTDASGYNLIFTGQRDGVRLLGVVMGGNTATVRDNAARTLLESGFRSPRDRHSITASADAVPLRRAARPAERVSTRNSARMGRATHTAAHQRKSRERRHGS